MLQSVRWDALVGHSFDPSQKAALISVLLALSRNRDLLSCEMYQGGAVKVVCALCEPDTEPYGVCLLANLSARSSFDLAHALECLGFLEERISLLDSIIDDAPDASCAESTDYDYPAHHSDPFANAQLALHEGSAEVRVPSSEHFWRLLANVSSIGTIEIGLLCC